MAQAAKWRRTYMIIAIFLGLAAGVALGFAFDFTYPTEYAFYITMGLLAALDSLLGAARSHLEGVYSNLIFITGFVVNALLAGALTYLGDLLGVPLYYAALLVFGGRLFNNMAEIRHILLERYVERRERKRSCEFKE
jgi:small basic protein